VARVSADDCPPYSAALPSYLAISGAAAMLKPALFLILFSIVTAASAQQWPLQFDAGPEWKIDYKGDKIDFFTLDRPNGENVFFTLSRWPAGGGRDQVPFLIARMAEGLEERYAGKPISLLIKNGYTIEDIAGAAFSGQAAIFTMRDSTLQVIFMVSDGDGIWSGQFLGSREIWAEAKIVLGSLSRHDKT
jgi:hypothetical protein